MLLMPFDFEQDIRSEVFTYLPYDKTESAIEAELRAMPTLELFIRFLNWRNRLIHSHPRQVKRSREIGSNPHYIANRRDVNRVCAKIAVGLDLSLHLSKRVVYGYSFRKPGKGHSSNRSLDLLLSDWSMHHLHISHTMESDSFAKRSGSLLIVLFREKVAYAIDVLEHGQWADQKLVEICLRNWPDEKMFLPLDGAIRLSNKVTSEDRASLRSSGVDSLIEIDGRVFMSAAGGISTSGVSSRAVMDAQRIYRLLDLYNEDPQRLRSDFSKCADKTGVRFPQKPRFRLKFAVTPESYAIVIREEVTRKMVQIF